MDVMDDLLSRVKDMQTDIRELVKQGAIHNQTLIEHERRSTNLESRITPLESDKLFQHKLYSSILGLGALSTALVSIVKLLHFV